MYIDNKYCRMIQFAHGIETERAFSIKVKQIKTPLSRNRILMLCICFCFCCFYKHIEFNIMVTAIAFYQNEL